MKHAVNQGALIDQDEAAENAAADVIGFRTNPQRGNFLAISMIRSQYRDDALAIASLSQGENTRTQLEALSISDVPQALEYIAFCVGYLAARMFFPRVGEGPTLSRLLMPDSEAIADNVRRDSIDRANQYLPALSEIHDNRAAPRDSRLVHRLLAGYLTILIEDPRQSTMDTLLRGFEEPDSHRGKSGLSARQIAESLDRSRLWSTLGWRRGLAERRFRPGPRGVYMENIAGDVRIIFNRDTPYVAFSDIRRLRSVLPDTVREYPHPCDDGVIGAWIAENCALARQTWLKPEEG